MRFVARTGELIQADKAPGRGVYTCRRLQCFERALTRRAFARTLRQTVRVEPALDGLDTQAR